MKKIFWKNEGEKTVINCYKKVVTKSENTDSYKHLQNRFIQSKRAFRRSSKKLKAGAITPYAEESKRLGEKEC